MAYSIDRMPERISIGRETETGVTDVMIDCGAWVMKWPGMVLHAIHTPEGGAPYILQTETDGGVLVWHVTDADTATPGTGRMEIVGETDGQRKVSAMVKVSVAARMGGTVGHPPEAAQPWVDRVVEAAGRITGMQAQAKTLDAGSSATAAWDGEQGLLTIGVPKGEKGAPGKDAVVDATLTQSGQAADAKATGEALAGKLDNTPGTWPAWTADEQAAALKKIGGAFAGWKKIEKIIIEEYVNNLVIRLNDYQDLHEIVIVVDANGTGAECKYKISVSSNYGYEFLHWNDSLTIKEEPYTTYVHLYKIGNYWKSESISPKSPTVYAATQFSKIIPYNKRQPEYSCVINSINLVEYDLGVGSAVYVMTR